MLGDNLLYLVGIAVIIVIAVVVYYSMIQGSASMAE